MDFSVDFRINEINEFLNSNERDCVLCYSGDEVDSVKVLIDGFFKYIEKYKDVDSFVSGALVSKNKIHDSYNLYFYKCLKNIGAYNLEYDFDDHFDDHFVFKYKNKNISFDFIHNVSEDIYETYHGREIRYLAFDNKQDFDIKTYDMFKTISRSSCRFMPRVIKSTYK